ncbi:hypothetical protein ABS71_14045 [bacterium SCN 62-11]|nr:EF-hand domain-containing protein [Candidatus Eremiobacteraeota bacterium]ODT63681.1 MAG: hypothetical protein ABS71_14045 [bacterium SCN 62-11]
MKKTLTLMLASLLAAAAWAQPTSSQDGGTLPGYEAKPGWVNQQGGDATANPGSDPQNARPWGQNGGGRGGRRGGGKRMARFDTNHDGKLDDTEKAAARAQMMKRFDTDGDGKVSDQERQAGRAQMMKRFDTDGDGKISDQEKQAARSQGRGFGRRNRGQSPNMSTPPNTSTTNP